MDCSCPKKSSKRGSGFVDLTALGLAALIISVIALPLINKFITERRIITQQRAILDCLSTIYESSSCDGQCPSPYTACNFISDVGGYKCCRPAPTATPTPSCRGTCFSDCPTNWSPITGTCTNPAYRCCAQNPTPTPTPACSGECQWGDCRAGYTGGVGNCNPGYICCTPIPTSTPLPTSTPTPRPCSSVGGMCRNACFSNENSHPNAICEIYLYCCVIKPLCPATEGICVSGEDCPSILTQYRCASSDQVCCATGPTPTISSCQGITYTLSPANPPANTSVSVVINRGGATSCFGNWDNVGLLLDGVSQGLSPEGATSYRATINSGSPATHTLQFTVNHGSCRCNSQTFTTGAALTPTQAITPTLSLTPTSTIVPTNIPTSPPTCAGGILGDLNCDSRINVTDLTMLLDKWGTNGIFANSAYHKADIAPGNGDGVVNSIDLTKLLDHWGSVVPTPTPR